jgi:hypothetical protein
LLARLILFCYFDDYPLSPIQSVVFNSATVSEALRDAQIDKTEPFVAPADAKFDAVLHLQMYVLAEKFDVRA